MASLQSLSNELHLSIFKFLNDLDDARDLARTCRRFSQLHTGCKRSIARSIIVSSNMKNRGTPIQPEEALRCFDTDKTRECDEI